MRFSSYLLPDQLHLLTHYFQDIQVTSLISIPQFGQRPFVGFPGVFLVAGLEQYVAGAFGFAAAEGNCVFGKQIIRHAPGVLRLLKGEKAFGGVEEIGGGLAAVQAVHFLVDIQGLAMLAFLKKRLGGGVEGLAVGGAELAEWRRLLAVAGDAVFLDPDQRHDATVEKGGAALQSGQQSPLGGRFQRG